MTLAVPQNAPVEAQATLPWLVAAPEPAGRPGGPIPPLPSSPSPSSPSPSSPSPSPSSPSPSGWRWSTYRVDGRGWSVAVLAATTGEAEITVDRGGATYRVRRWLRAARATALRSGSEDTWTCDDFGKVIDLAVEKTR